MEIAGWGKPTLAGRIVQVLHSQKSVQKYGLMVKVYVWKSGDNLQMFLDVCSSRKWLPDIFLTLCIKLVCVFIAQRITRVVPDVPYKAGTYIHHMQNH